MITIAIIALYVYVAGAIGFPILLRHVIYRLSEVLYVGLLWPFWLGGLAFWFVATELRPWRR